MLGGLWSCDMGEEIGDKKGWVHGNFYLKNLKHIVFIRTRQARNVSFEARL
jgi:hypothetical protein